MAGTGAAAGTLGISNSGISASGSILRGVYAAGADGTGGAAGGGGSGTAGASISSSKFTEPCICLASCGSITGSSATGSAFLGAGSSGAGGVKCFGWGCAGAASGLSGEGGSIFAYSSRDVKLIPASPSPLSSRTSSPPFISQAGMSTTVPLFTFFMASCLAFASSLGQQQSSPSVMTSTSWGSPNWASTTLWLAVPEQ